MHSWNQHSHVFIITSTLSALTFVNVSTDVLIFEVHLIVHWTNNKCLEYVIAWFQFYQVTSYVALCAISEINVSIKTMMLTSFANLLFELSHLSKEGGIHLQSARTLDCDHHQVNWFTLSLLRTTDRNDHSTKPMAYRNSEHVHEPRLWTSIH